MDPVYLLLAFLAMNRKAKPAAELPAATNGVNGSHDVPTVTLRAGGLYRFKGTLGEGAPNAAEVKKLLRLVAGTQITIGRRQPRQVSFVVRLPMDVPFAAGSSHPQAPWLTLESADELPPNPLAARPQGAPRARGSRARANRK